MSETFTIEYNDGAHYVKICGIEYSIGLFHAMAEAELGSWLRIDARNKKDARVTVTRISPRMERIFDAILRADP